MTDPADKKLSSIESEFLNALQVQTKRDLGAAYASVAKCTPSSAHVGGSKMLKRPHVKAEYLRRMGERGQRANLVADDLLREVASIVKADPRELMEYRRGACRYCYGQDFRYHRTPAEYERDLDAYKAANKAASKGPKRTEEPDPFCLGFNPRGGIGFNPNKTAHKGCPECFGHGVGYTYVKDSRTVSKAAARLYAGIKETKDGVEVKTRSADKHVHLAMQHLGMLDKDENKNKATPEEQADKIKRLIAEAGGTIGGPGQ